MKKKLKPDWFLVIILLILLATYISGIASVPFHPDESTQLAMSSDFETLMTRPELIVWNSSPQGDPSQTYRLLDAPLTRYLIEIGRNLVGQPPPSGFWNWSLDWQENIQRNAFPGEEVLLAARSIISILFPFSLIFLYLSAQTIGGKVGGYSAIILLGLNALILLHTRRAMAEGPLLFGITAVMASWRDAPRRPWLAGLAMAIALNAKQSSLALFPVGLLAVSWVTDSDHSHRNRIIGNIIQYGLFFAAITWILNPAAWQKPLATAKAAIQARAALLSQQVADTELQAPSQVLDDPVERTAILIGHLYLTQPMFAEAENYRTQTDDEVAAYLANPFNNLGRNYIGAGFYLAMTVVGLFAAVQRIGKSDSPGRRYTLLVLFGTIFMAGGLLLAIPLPWQRYVIPVIPFACLWAGIGCSWMFHLPKKIKNTKFLIE